MNNIKPVTLKLRSEILSLYPNALRKASYMRMLYYILFTTKRDKGGYPIIDRETVARIEDKVCDTNYLAHPFLFAFKNDVLSGVGISSWSKEERRARVIVFKTPSFLLQLKRKIPKKRDNLIDFVTGNKLSSFRENKMDKIAKFEAYNYKLMKYLNSLPQKTFTTIFDKNWNNVCEKYAELTLRKDDKYNEIWLDQQASILWNILGNPKPIYSQSLALLENDIAATDRIFAFNHVQQLYHELRNVLCAGTYDFDLKSCHLAIIAKRWNIPELYDFLKSNESIWNRLEKYFDTKKDAKKYLYSLVYGKTETNLRKTNSEVLNDELIKIIMNARERELSRIEHEYNLHSGKGVKRLKRRILACESQRVEMELLYPLIDLLGQNKRIKMIAYMFDGFILNFTHKVREEQLVKKVIKTINTRCHELDIPTVLEYEKL